MTRAAPTSASLLAHDPETLRALLASWNEPAYRASQLLEWVYRHGVQAYTEMTNLPARLRERLATELPIYSAHVAREAQSTDGTIKHLLRWPDDSTTECVMIPDGDRRTACISSQVGCPVGCRFCASGLLGLERQLSAAEIIEQALRMRQVCGTSRLSNVVFMGMGEPLANYAATLHAVRTINADWGLGIGARKITISTVGLPAQMRRLADEQLQVTLALSLHAPTDDLRRQIIPWAEYYTVAELVHAARYYFDRTGREITLEYILLGGLNDTAACAADLAHVARGMRSNVNLIQYNPVSGLPFRRPDEQDAHRFLHALRDRGVNAHLRRSRGMDIDSACGQLRQRELQSPVAVSVSGT